MCIRDRKWKALPGIQGCIILSTCNRMEIWVSAEAGDTKDLLELLCEEKHLSLERHRSAFTRRQDKEAVEHLFWLTCGLKSQILAEDQIITQVKEALSLAREHYTTDGVLELSLIHI